MLEARSLTKYYDHTPAVRQVSFTIQPGEILGYLGPNGAGKSTTVKMLTGLIEPSEGQIFYRGRSVYDDFTAFQRRIGYVPEEPHLYPHLTGREYLQLVGRLRDIPRRILEPKMDQFLRLFALWDDRHAPLASYSKGMRQKILLSAALLHDPDILILDEPFSGLDVTSALVLRRLLSALAGRGKMILYSSHVLEVVEKVCSKVLILRKGEVVAYDSISRLQELMSQPSLEGVFAQLAQVEDGGALANRILDAMSYGKDEPPEPPGMRLTAEPLRSGEKRGEHIENSQVRRGEVAWYFAPAVGRALGSWILLGSRILRFSPRFPLRPPRLRGELLQDIRYGLRMLARAPGFTAVALISLTLGIGVATSAFSEMNGLILRSVPGVAQPGALVTLDTPVSYPQYGRYRARSDLFSGTLAYIAPVPFGVSRSGRTERIWGHLVTASYFSTLGVHPVMGRLFHQEDEQPGRAPAVVVSYRFWQNHLGSDAAAIGTALRVNGQPCIVIGVAPRDFLGASPMVYAADLWLPVSVPASVAPELADKALERYDAAIFHVVGRLQPGVAASGAEAALDAVARQVEQEYGDPDRNQKGRRVTLLPGGKVLPIPKKDLPMLTGYLTLLGSMLLLIACSNVANMMLARAADRRRETAIRLALGASRARLVRQLLTESMLVAAGAGVLGFLMAVWLMHGASQFNLPYPMPLRFDLEPDRRVLLFTAALTILTGLAFGLAPALRATRTDLTPALKEGGNVRLRRYRRLSLRNLLVLSQVAGSLMLLVITGFLVRGHQRMAGADVGFEARNLYVMSLDPVRDGYSGAEAAAFFPKLLDRVRRLPSVTAASLADSSPMAMIGKPSVRYSVSGLDEGGSRVIHSARKFVVSRDFFDTVGIPILLGRGFRNTDEADDSPAVIVSEKLVRECWKGQDPLGRRIEIGNDEIPRFRLMSSPGTPGGYRPGASTNARRLQVIGVAKDIRDGLAMVAADAPAVIYLPRRPADDARPTLQGVTLLMRAAPGVDSLDAVRREIAAMDTRLTPFHARSMPEQIRQMMFPVQVALWTYGGIGVFGLILASVGLAGVTAYSVTQRRREIGIRIALGAARGDVLGLVMKEGAVLVTAGTVIGLTGAWAGIRLLSAFMSTVARTAGTSTSDPVLLVGAPLLLAALSLGACYVPARKSMRIDPAVALRQE